MNDITNKTLIQKWISKLGLQDIPITVREGSEGETDLGFLPVRLSRDGDGFLIEYHRELGIYYALHKLGYIYIAKGNDKLKQFKQSFFSHRGKKLTLESLFFDLSIEQYFRKIDLEYKEFKEIKTFNHSGSRYNKWFEEAKNTTNLIGIWGVYLSDYFKFTYLMPLYWKNKLEKMIKQRFNTTRNLILKKAKIEGINFNKDDFIPIHDLLEFNPETLDYEEILGKANRLKKLLIDFIDHFIWG